MLDSHWGTGAALRDTHLAAVHLCDTSGSDTVTSSQYFFRKTNVCCQVKKKKKKTVTHLTTKSAFRMDSLGHERFGSEGQRTC